MLFSDSVNPCCEILTTVWLLWSRLTFAARLQVVTLNPKLSLHTTKLWVKIHHSDIKHTHLTGRYSLLTAGRVLAAHTHYPPDLMSETQLRTKKENSQQKLFPRRNETQLKRLSVSIKNNKLSATLLRTTSVRSSAVALRCKYKVCRIPMVSAKRGPVSWRHRGARTQARPRETMIIARVWYDVIIMLL